MTDEHCPVANPASIQKGFTLLELTLYIGVFVILALAVTNLFIPLARGRGNVVAQSDVHTSMNFVVEKIGQDLRESTFISTPSMTGDGNSTATLVLDHPDGIVTWCVDTGRLRRAVDAACDDTIDPLTPSTVLVAAPTFTRWDNTNADLPARIVSVEFDLTLSYNSTNPDYQYSESKTTTVSIRHNLCQTAGVTIFEEGGGSTDVTEAGGTDTYTIVLDQGPTASVTITGTPDGELGVANSPFTFTTMDWSTSQQETVNAVDDMDIEGAHTGTITHAATSTDVCYNGIDIDSVTANITDND